ncbi:hypothetical protein SAMN05216345_111136 [Cupriavidus sp. YR651]|nr:hypothetical protein SAMN05216345_111136 [Cupriavidus sp. YR651]
MNPTMTISGHNPEISLTLEKTVPTSNGFGYAVTQAVQFNVNQDAPAGSALFVDPNNNAVVQVTLTSDHVFTDAWALFPSSVDQSGAPRVEIVTAIEPNGKVAIFTMRTGDPWPVVLVTAFVLQFAPDGH